MKFGVIGLGSIGMRHAKNLLAMGHTVLGYDPDGSRMKLLLEQGGEAGWMKPEAVSSGILDAVVITTPTHQHWAGLDAAITAGKHVFVEKPIGDIKMTNADCFRIAKKKNLVIMVGNNLRFHSCVKKAKEWMPKIGQPLWANFTLAQYNDKPAYLRDGVILNWGAHEIDLALYLLGEVKVMSSVVGRGREETIADIGLLHANGCAAHIHLDYLTKPEWRGFDIIGTDGRMHCNLVERYIGFRGSHEDGFWGNDSFDENYIEEMQAFIDRINGKQTLGATGEEGLACLEILLRAKEMANPPTMIVTGGPPYRWVAP